MRKCQDVEIFEKYVRMEKVVIAVRELKAQREKLCQELVDFWMLDAAMAELDAAGQPEEDND